MLDFAAELSNLVSCDGNFLIFPFGAPYTYICIQINQQERKRSYLQYHRISAVRLSIVHETLAARYTPTYD